MKIHDHVSSHHSFMYLWIVGAVLVLAGLSYSYIGSHPDGIIDGQHEGDVRTTVAQFGNQLNTVSLLSPTASEDIRKAYAPYVTPELLAAWVADPSSAPGRLTSSPWPDHIETDTVTMNENGSYDVLGRIMLMTSTGDAGIIPVSLTVADVDGGFLITRYQESPRADEQVPVLATTTATVALGETATVGDVTITPTSVEEDSRCPSDVQCIQAGTVRVLVHVASAMGESDMTLTLGAPATLEAETVTLTAVTPGKISTKPADDAAYRFTFEVAHR
jgi:hypothetical protein